MRQLFFVLYGLLALITHLPAQPKLAAAGKPWLVSNVSTYRPPAPPDSKSEIADVLSAQKALNTAGLQQIDYWNAGAPGYRWQEMINKLWMIDTGRSGALANMLLGTAIYDATLAAMEAKHTYARQRPFAVDKRIMLYAVQPTTSSYPCERSVAAGVAATVIAHFYPHLADSVNRLAAQLMASRVAAGLAYPSDTRAGFALGKRIAEDEIQATKTYVYTNPWDEKRPQGAGYWSGKKPMAPTAGFNKTVVLQTASEFRPGPPPDFAKEMAEMKAYKQNFRSQAAAFYWASQDYWSEALNKKIFEHNVHLDPLRAASLYAASAVAAYDCFAACFDAKYAYWGIRPDQYDTTYRSLIPTPPFPGYPSGHAAMSGMYSELYAYFFPEDAALFRRKAKDAAESRFQAGIHFRTDNEVGLELGRKVAAAVVTHLQTTADATDKKPTDKTSSAKTQTKTAF